MSQRTLVVGDVISEGFLKWGDISAQIAGIRLSDDGGPPIFSLELRDGTEMECTEDDFRSVSPIAAGAEVPGGAESLSWDLPTSSNSTRWSSKGLP